MILSIIILLVLLGIAYFHYAQGLFGATISAVIAIVAAAIAVGYHENLVMALLGGAVGDYANAGALVAIFALVYIIGRVITDKMIPGNIRLPVAVDRVGGAIMGIIAAIFATGIVALAAQALPFGPSVGGHTRYAVEGMREVTVTPTGASRAVDMEVHDQLDEDGFVDEKRKKLLIPVDDMTLSFVQKLSGGALAGARTLNSVHPDYADELFAQRLGVQLGGKMTAFNGAGKPAQASLADPGVFVVPQDLTKNQIDAELDDLHTRQVAWKKGGRDVQLVLRIMFNKDAADSDGNVRLAPASVRLVANGTNYFPVGTLENGQLYSNKVDDFLFVNVKGADAGADFVFFVNPDDVIAGGASAFAAKDAAAGAKDAKDAPKIQDGVFVEVKRLARVDLSGKPVLTSVPKAENVQVERKPKLLEQRAKKAATPAAPAAPDPEAAPAPATPAPAAGEKKNPMQTIREGAAEKEKLVNPK
ncbi:MAG: hypothetical protein QOF78_715 [Phycisphaerales bacterium]|jgi:hypothetical protein|nr:hypothetical protein [Phycisphaerales bacterium]